jgi:hypothetical protein
MAIDGELRPEQIIKTPENETVQETAELLDSRKFIEESKVSEQVTPAPVVLPDAQASATPQATSQIILAKVENILAAEMDNVFLSLDIASQAKFKAKGEQVAIEITNLLQKTKVNINKIISLIVDWLRLIPHVNKYYLEQEAKLKADAILHFYKKDGADHN